LTFYGHPEERERRLVSAHFSRRAMTDPIRSHHSLETIWLPSANDWIGAWAAGPINGPEGR